MSRAAATKDRETVTQSRAAADLPGKGPQSGIDLDDTAGLLDLMEDR